MTDENVSAAIAHWAPRLIANGVDYNDFLATTARIGRWSDWCREWMRTGEMHERLAREADERGSAISAAEARVRAAIAHHFGKFVFFEDMDLYVEANDAVARNYRAAAAHLDPPAEIVAIPYAGTMLPGYLRKPKGVDRPPVAIIICGLDSVKEEMNSLEPLFHRNGIATLSFDGPGQGASEALPIEPEFEKPAGAVVDWIEGRADLDGGRVGALGVSLGGYYASRAAAYEKRLRCAVSAGGPYDFGETVPTMPPISRQAFQTRSHMPDWESAAEHARRLTMKEASREIDMPFLIVFGKRDRLIPYQQAERLHREIRHPQKRLALYEEGNHICNNMPYAWRPLATDWMAAHMRA